MTGISNVNENSESGGSHQVSPRQQLSDHSPNEHVSPDSFNVGGNGLLSVGSDDSLIGSTQKSNLSSNHSDNLIKPHRSRSASDISKLDAPIAGHEPSVSPHPEDRNGIPSVVPSSSPNKKLFSNSETVDASGDTLPELPSPSFNTIAERSEPRGLRYSKSIPVSYGKNRRSTVHYPGSTIGALAMSIHRKQSSKLRRRLVFKNGDSNISATNVHKMSQRYLADIFTTLVDMQWRWTILLFGSSFFISWVFFAAMWWLIAFLHDDLREDDPRHGTLVNGLKPCAQFVYSFPTALLFSIELQTTIGFGFRHTTDECPHGIALNMIQAVFSVLLQAFMAGIILSKLSRPLKRAETLMFSKHAVICERDGSLCFLIRIGDMRKSHILDGKIRALMIKKRETREGETLPLYQHNVELQMECGDQQLYLFWPLIACHVIDENSPFYNISLNSFKDERFELIVILEGVVESTGMSTQAKTSYLPSEIKWGRRFTPLITYQKEDGTYQIDYRLFDETYDVETPMCSARELAERREKGMTVPMKKPDGFQAGDSSPTREPSINTNGRYSRAYFGAPSVYGNPFGNDTGHHSEAWPAGPRSSVLPHLSQNSWLNWIRKRKRQPPMSNSNGGGMAPIMLQADSEEQGKGDNGEQKLARVV